jgi:hypothetical protein
MVGTLFASDSSLLAIATQTLDFENGGPNREAFARIGKESESWWFLRLARNWISPHSEQRRDVCIRTVSTLKDNHA